MTPASIVLATYGDLAAEAAPGWTWDRMRDRAYESALGQGAEIIAYHDPDPDPCALGRARNAGIEATTGEWVLCLDADDELAPGCVPALLAAGGVDTAIDPAALNHYLSFHAVVPAPHTLLAGVRFI